MNPGTIRIEFAFLVWLSLSTYGLCQQPLPVLSSADVDSILGIESIVPHDRDLLAPPEAFAVEGSDSELFPSPADSKGEVVACLEIDSSDDVPQVGFGDWLGYNSTDGDFGWLTGNGDRLGMFSIESFPTLDLDSDSALTLGSGFHFLNGPTSTDLPPRLYDLQLAYHSRKIHSDRFMLDYRLGVGVFSDFEGSARKGVRFPGHAVSYFELDPWLISVFGIEVLDRDDVSVLPVAGFVWRPDEDVICELVFPRPKVQVRATAKHSVYIAGELGGGTWAIERDSQANDNVTYRDFRVLLGWVDFEHSDSAWELGWVFGRKLDYRSSIGNYHPDDTLLIRVRTFY
ncbi:MAG: hypothetical protein NXI32_24920 [bacterium]|nr:hypothetical protein [bacterium]